MSAKYENEPTLRVGILAAPSIVVALHGEFSSPEGTLNGGEIKAELSGDGKILWNGAEYDSLNFKASDDSARFEIRDVIIGVNFHWERRENQTFKGDLAFVVEKGMLEAVNIVKVEDYLRSVISSEMSATASPALLRAHAVISRSWLLAQIEKHNRIDTGDTAKHPMRVSDTEICRWQDREDHELFDVCADDHCQRYQGTTRQTTEAVDLAVNETAGMVLTGTEIKSIRAGHASLGDTFCYVSAAGEVWVKNMNIAQYFYGTYNNHAARRDRKLLLNKKEIAKIIKSTKDSGLTVVPLRLFINGKGLAKLVVGIARGKKEYDKRQSIKERDDKRALARLMHK